MITPESNNGTQMIGAMRSAIDSQSPSGQLQRSITVENGDLKATFSLPKKTSASNVWYCQTALEALKQKFDNFGPREIKADVYKAGDFPISLGTIVVARERRMKRRY